MLRDSFQKMAAMVERLDNDALIDTGAHLLVHALEVAHGHAPGEVRAFANGCDHNSYAHQMRPMLSMFTVSEDVGRLRHALRDLFAHGSIDQAWSNWAGPEADPKAGLMRFLNCTTPARAFYYSRLAA